MTTLSLSANKTIIKGGETVNFTANYPGEVGKEIKLMQKGFTALNDMAVGNALTNSSGIAVITWKAPTAGTFHFYALRSIVPYYAPLPIVPVRPECGFWCDTSSEVSVSVTDAPCDPADILCNFGGGIEASRKDMMRIIAVAVIVVIVLIFIFYMPKKR